MGPETLNWVCVFKIDQEARLIQSLYSEGHKTQGWYWSMCACQTVSMFLVTGGILAATLPSFTHLLQIWNCSNFGLFPDTQMLYKITVIITRELWALWFYAPGFLKHRQDDQQSNLLSQFHPLKLNQPRQTRCVKMTRNLNKWMYKTNK